MASRAQILNDPRSGASEGATRGGRPAPDQGTRDELAAARERTRARGGRPAARTSSKPAKPVGKVGRGPADTAEIPATGEDEGTSSASSAPAEGGSPSAAGESPAPSSASSPRSFGTDGAGAFLALVIYPLIINFLQGGTAQMLGWVKAKWVNEPYAGRAPASFGNQARQHRGAGAILQKGR